VEICAISLIDLKIETGNKKKFTGNNQPVVPKGPNCFPFLLRLRYNPLRMQGKIKDT